VAAPAPNAAVRLSAPAGRRVLGTTVLGSSMALLDSTVVNVALPSIGRSFDAGIAGLQWTVGAYMLTLASLLLLGGALGDRYGRRRVYRVGVIWFTLASAACAAAPTLEVLVAARALQGIGGALLTPGALALIQSTIHPDDRGRAIGAWSGLSGVAAALGPLVGGWLVESLGWRWIFLVNLPIGAAVTWGACKIPETLSLQQQGRLDAAGGALAVIGLGAIAYAFIASDAAGLGATWPWLAAGVAALAAFVAVERRAGRPMLPLSLFASPDFTGANLVTFFAYAALGGTFFFVVLYLQVVAGYEPLLAGLALLPISVVMLLLSSWVGGLAGRKGPRRLLTGGCAVAAIGMVLLGRLGPHPSFLVDVVPAMLVVAAGLTFAAVPVTVAVLAAADPRHAGAASGVNNAVARTAGLLAIAVLPAATGLGGSDYADALGTSFPRAMRVCAVLLGLAAVTAWASIRDDRLRAPPEEREPPSSCPLAGPPPGRDPPPLDRRRHVERRADAATSGPAGRSKGFSIRRRARGPAAATAIASRRRPRGPGPPG